MKCERCESALRLSDPQMVGCYPHIRKLVALACTQCWWIKSARFV